jgi:hypothetical protein
MWILQFSGGGQNQLVRLWSVRWHRRLGRKIDRICVYPWYGSQCTVCAQKPRSLKLPSVPPTSVDAVHLARETLIVTLNLSGAIG